MTAYGVRGANSPAVPFCGQTISGAWPRPSAVARPKSWVTRWPSGSAATAIWCACRFHHAPVLPACGTSPIRRRAAARAKKVGRSPACVETARSYRRHRLRTKASVSPAEGRVGMDTMVDVRVALEDVLGVAEHQHVERRPRKSPPHGANEWRGEQHIAEAAQRDHEDARALGQLKARHRNISRRGKIRSWFCSQS